MGSHGNHEGLTDRLEIGLDISHGAVQRKNSRDIQSGCTLEVGEAAHCLGQASGPGVRVVFCGHVHHRHRLTCSGAEGRGRR
jgi:hypothetical protein